MCKSRLFLGWDQYQNIICWLAFMEALLGSMKCAYIIPAFLKGLKSILEAVLLRCTKCKWNGKDDNTMTVECPMKLPGNANLVNKEARCVKLCCKQAQCNYTQHTQVVKHRTRQRNDQNLPAESNNIRSNFTNSDGCSKLEINILFMLMYFNLIYNCQLTTIFSQLDVIGVLFPIWRKTSSLPTAWLYTISYLQIRNVWYS